VVGTQGGNGNLNLIVFGFNFFPYFSNPAIEKGETQQNKPPRRSIFSRLWGKQSKSFSHPSVSLSIVLINHIGMEFNFSAIHQELIAFRPDAGGPE
jgi:hypothetical protein